MDPSNNILCSKTTSGDYNLYVRDGTNRTIYVSGRIVGVRYFTATNFLYALGGGDTPNSWIFDLTKSPDIIAGRFNPLPTYDLTIVPECSTEVVGTADSCIIGNDDPYSQNPADDSYNRRYDSYDVDFRAIGEVRLIDGFHVKRGADFHAYIKPPYLEHEITSFPTREEFSPLIYPGTGVAQRNALKKYWTFNTDNLSGWDESAISINANRELVIDEYFPATGTTHYSGELSSKDAIHTSNSPIGRYDALAKICTSHGTQSAVWMWGTNGAESNEFDFPEIKTTGYRRSVTEPWEYCTNTLGMGTWRWHELQKVLTADPAFADGSDRVVVNVSDVGVTFHLYSLEIEKDEWRFLIDDCVVARLPNYSNSMIVRRYADGIQTQIYPIANSAKGYDHPNIAQKFPLLWKFYARIVNHGQYDTNLTASPQIGSSKLLIKYLRTFDR